MPASGKPSHASPVAQNRDGVDRPITSSSCGLRKRWRRPVAQAAQDAGQRLATCGVNDAVGSSSSSTRERSESARAISIICIAATLSPATVRRG